MSAARESTLIAVQGVRKDAALVLELCDAAVSNLAKISGVCAILGEGKR
jgi:hypothetical protein